MVEKPHGYDDFIRIYIYIYFFLCSSEKAVKIKPIPYT